MPLALHVGSRRSDRCRNIDSKHDGDIDIPSFSRRASGNNRYCRQLDEEFRAHGDPLSNSESSHCLPKRLKQRQAAMIMFDC